MPLNKHKHKNDGSGSGSGFWSKLVGKSGDSDRSRPGIPSRQEISGPIPQPQPYRIPPIPPASNIVRPDVGPYQQPFNNVSQPMLRPAQNVPGPRSRTPQPPQQSHPQGYPPRSAQRSPIPQRVPQPNQGPYQLPYPQPYQPPYPVPSPHPIQQPFQQPSRSPVPSSHQRSNTLQPSMQTPYTSTNRNRSTSALPVPQYSSPGRRSPSPMRPSASPPSVLYSPRNYVPASPPMQFGQFQRNQPSPQSIRSANYSPSPRPSQAIPATTQGRAYSPNHQPPVNYTNPRPPEYPSYNPYDQRVPARPAQQIANRYPSPISPAESFRSYDSPNSRWAPSPVTQYPPRLQRGQNSLRRMPTTRKQQRMSMEVPAAVFVIVADDEYVQPFDVNERDSLNRPPKNPILRISEISDSDSESEDNDETAGSVRRGDSPASSATSLDPMDEELLEFDFNERWANNEDAPGWYVKEPEDVPLDDPKHLCGTCRRIDTSFLYQQKSTNTAPEPEDFVRIGTLADMLLKFKNCGLCHFFMRLIAFEVATTKLGHGFTTEQMGEVFFGDHVGNLDNQAIEYSIWPIQFEDGYDVPTMYLCRGPPPKPSTDLAVLVRPNYLFGWRQVHSCCRAPNTGRHVDARDSLDFEWIKEQLKLCNERSVGRGLYQTRDVQIRAIDVHDMCIVDLKDSDEYVTLSYVWGDAKQVKLIWETEALLRKPRGLLPFWDRIPKTIQDAIVLTRKIGLDYLWVDALCIMQDDQEDKGRQIKHMGNIYETSILTIQARCGKDATHGLPGVQPGTRNVRQLLGIAGKSLVCNTLSVADEERSVWSTRAWTLQENVLSQRKLIITDQACQWWCSHTSTVEDLHCRHKYWPVGEKFQNMFFYNTGHDGLDGSTKRKSNFDTYAYLVADYSQRSMKYPGDAENAVLGIFDAIKGMFRRRFTHGLPDLELLSAMLWMPIGSSHRRVYLDTGTPFWPSWSWLGWIGHVCYLWANERTMPLTAYGSPVKWLHVDEDGTETWEARTPSTSYEFTRLDDDPWCWNNSYYTGTTWWSANTIDRDTQIIQPGPHTHRLDFRTLCASFKLSGNPVKRRNIYNFQHDVYEMHVLDDEGFAIGAINVPDPKHFTSAQDRTFEGGEALHEFVVVSRASINNDPRVGIDEVTEKSLDGTVDFFERSMMIHGSSFPDADRTIQFTDPVGSFDKRLYSDEIPYCLYNVLMIERVKDVAFRVAVGRIHVAAFTLGRLHMDHIRLE